MPTYLSAIVAAHRAQAASDHRDPEELAAAAAAAPPPASFGAALAAASAQGLAVIAEVKRRSPSRGDLALGLDPAAVAGEYAEGGATCLSVLTDAAFFGGCVEDLVAAKAPGLPVLRKDFTVSAADVCDARLMGADAVLLIAAALSRQELDAYLALSRRLQLDALVEVHDEAELDVALAAGATLVGVNQRDLRTFEVDHDRARRLAERIPPGVVAVAESGVRDGADAARLAAAGFQAVLVGETLVVAADRRAAVRRLTGHPVRPRAPATPGGAGAAGVGARR